INGARARYQLLWNQELFQEQVRRRAPDLIALAYGTNESGDDDVPIETYRDRLRQVVTRMRATAPEASCLLIGPSDRPLTDRRRRSFEERPRTAQVVETQRSVAVEQGCGFFDLVAFSGGPNSIVAWAHHEPPYAQRD